MLNSKLKRPKISLFGHFGAGNFGNESTLQAMLCNLRRLMPDAEVTCICTVPEVVAVDYEIAALPISGVVVKPWNTRNPLVRLARKVFIGIPSELYRWLRGIGTLWHTDALVVVGTGLLTDAFCLGAWGPYSSFKWSVIAKLCRCRLMFLSVGAGPLERRTGRLFVKSALSLATFRSYRDEATLEYLKGIGFRPSDDRVYPDLAFSLPAVSDRAVAKGHRSTVGLGLMAYDGMCGIEKTTRAHYAAYIEALASFAIWLLNRGYDIRLLTGDPADTQVAREFKSVVKQRSATDGDVRIIAEPIASAKDLLSQLAATDFVVATRFHNVLLALFLYKPSISISFHHKCSSLMDQMDLREYCQDIRLVNTDRLIEQFCELEKNAGSLTQMIQRKVADCREALEEQYKLIASDFLVGQGRETRKTSLAPLEAAEPKRP
jgi:polysaccharide pyruvyl transferase WcaK-like protein